LPDLHMCSIISPAVTLLPPLPTASLCHIPVCPKTHCHLCGPQPAHAHLQQPPPLKHSSTTTTNRAAPALSLSLAQSLSSSTAAVLIAWRTFSAYASTSLHTKQQQQQQQQGILVKRCCYCPRYANSMAPQTDTEAVWLCVFLRTKPSRYMRSPLC
jgi:hypothetical protein